MVQQQYLVLEHIFYDAFNPGPSTLAIFTHARHAMLTKYFNYIAWCQGTESQEANFILVISTISRSLKFSLESRGYDKADFLFFCTRLYLDNLAGHRWFSDLMKFGPYKIRGNVVDLLEAMLRYEHQLNKATYCKMTTSLELNSRGWNGHNSHCSYFTPFPYKPISERLLRFIPFERRIFSPDTQGQDSVGTITFR
ncbi:hypothetical protein BDN70DRAFT_533680 [Pholiota conissans]|uniref:Uncharacterized protein n=1 Tax=Pholiota conissans TaxID=109636 RepID=A0A9P5ZED9_9AGAR|nr:hypothetical protein BDN70DRAFT_533680 [Pholiota conissans]